MCVYFVCGWDLHTCACQYVFSPGFFYALELVLSSAGNAFSQMSAQLIPHCPQVSAPIQDILGDTFPDHVLGRPGVFTSHLSVLCSLHGSCEYLTSPSGCPFCPVLLITRTGMSLISVGSQCLE